VSTIILNLSDGIANELADASREANQSPEAFTEELVRRALSVRKIREARGNLVEYGKAAGCESDEDIFKAIP
jgi:hypothetical protein